MKIKVFQINSERDKNRVKFENLARIEEYQGDLKIDSFIYDEVFYGDVDCKDLEDVFRLFNTDPPLTHRGHSLSVSDIVQVEGDAPKLVGRIRFYNSSTAFEECSYTDREKYNADIAEAYEVGRTIEAQNYADNHVPTVENGCYFCDSIGFQKVEFDPSHAQKPDNLLKVVIVEPNKPAYQSEIEDSLKGMQRAVRGMIEATYPFDDNAFIYSNEESKLNGMEGNRKINGELYAGPIIIVGDDGYGGNCSLTDEQLQKYTEQFQTPEQYTQEDVQDSIYMIFQSF